MLKEDQSPSQSEAAPESNPLNLSQDLDKEFTGKEKDTKFTLLHAGEKDDLSINKSNCDIYLKI